MSSSPNAQSVIASGKVASFISKVVENVAPVISEDLLNDMEEKRKSNRSDSKK